MKNGRKGDSAGIRGKLEVHKNCGWSLFRFCNILLDVGYAATHAHAFFVGVFVMIASL